jgi:hypothetical protein
VLPGLRDGVKDCASPSADAVLRRRRPRGRARRPRGRPRLPVPRRPRRRRGGPRGGRGVGGARPAAHGRGPRPAR